VVSKVGCNKLPANQRIGCRQFLGSGSFPRASAKFKCLFFSNEKQFVDIFHAIRLNYIAGWYRTGIVLDNERIQKVVTESK
jgi:hypothetical protein